MNFIAEQIRYGDTGSFSKIVLDYLDDAASLKPFYNYRPDIEGIKKAVADRNKFPVNRQLLVDVLQRQYNKVQLSAPLKSNIDALLSENTFTVCTAHQPNIFTGHLYFIYKILHAVKLCDALNYHIADKKFVPVYYMGSEDADLQELGEVNILGSTYQWHTDQKGAVGRMKIDTNFLQIIDAIEGQLAVEKFGKEIMHVVREAYTEGQAIEQATFNFVHALFNDLGLVILLPDNRELKKQFAPVIKRELESQFSHASVNNTVENFPAEYKVQAAGRDINLFYLDENSRERIEKKSESFSVANTSLHFSKDTLFAGLQSAPEKFSPNVILRPVFQEMILPDIAFIGGGGELAYWLELKDVFAEANAFFPVLLLRNSFSVLNKNAAANLQKLSLTGGAVFKTEQVLLEELVKRETAVRLSLNEEKESLKDLYKKVKTAAENVDGTLSKHAEALHTQGLHRIEVLEKKMLKAEKKKFEAAQRQIHKIKTALFPGGILQERSDNILQYLSIYGMEFLHMLYENSQAFPETFTILKES